MMLKNYTQSSLLQKYLNMKLISRLPRTNTIKEYYMSWLYKDIDIIFNLEEQGYTGYITTCVRTRDNKYLLYSDFRGTCSVCEWLNEDIDDETLLRMCKSIVSDTLIFETIEDLKEFIIYVKLYYDEPEHYDNTYKWKGNANEMFEILGTLQSDYEYHERFKQVDMAVLDEYQVYWYKSKDDSYSNLFYVYRGENLVTKYYKSFYSTNIIAFDEFDRQSDVISTIESMTKDSINHTIEWIKKYDKDILSYLDNILPNFKISTSNIIRI